MFQRELRDLQFVPRWSIIRKLRTQSVAEHSFYTAVYANQLQQLMNWEVKSDLISYYIMLRALWHDVEECFTGDIPGPVKRAIRDKDKFDDYVREGMEERFNSGSMDAKGQRGAMGPVFPAYLSRLTVESSITKQVDLFVKAASLLDEVMYLAGEIQMGNGAVKNMTECSGQRLKEAIYALPAGEVTDSKPRVNVNHDYAWSVIQDAITMEMKSTSKIPS